MLQKRPWRCVLTTRYCTGTAAGTVSGMMSGGMSNRMSSSSVRSVDVKVWTIPFQDLEIMKQVSHHMRQKRLVTCAM